MDMLGRKRRAGEKGLAAKAMVEKKGRFLKTNLHNEVAKPYQKSKAEPTSKRKRKSKSNMRSTIACYGGICGGAENLWTCDKVDKR